MLCSSIDREDLIQASSGIRSKYNEDSNNSGFFLFLFPDEPTQQSARPQLLDYFERATMEVLRSAPKLFRCKEDSLEAFICFQYH